MTHSEVPKAPSTAEGIAAGRALRARTPLRELARLGDGSRDPIGILARQNETRVADLVPLRTERMSASPFTFYRGTAALMAADLAQGPSSGIRVASCGDAHVANFGFYASPARELVFDLNDFDEAAWAPWEWDVKRLVASVVIAGQATARDDEVVQDAARRAVRVYARALRAGLKLSPVQRYFTHFSAEAAVAGLDKASRTALRSATRDARKRTGERAARRTTGTNADGRRVFVENPPALTHVEPALVRSIHSLVDQYVDSANVDIRVLLQGYRVADVAHRVVGVGSVGTRCFLILLEDGDGGTLLLQAKEAGRSVLVEHGGVAQPEEVEAFTAEHGQGGRVVALQRILQAASDPFLGYLRSSADSLGGGADLYVRQFHDMKGGIDMETLDDVPFARYAEACAAVLARAHAQSPAAAAVAGYVGGGRAVAEPVLEWAYGYAALSREDYDAFLDAAAAASAP
ncbi:DUF2252 domain-containing protein [Microbacterium horticulturae]|uniref:DUF2252 domain-containing protein n=1 Tax=Microbacterium horticulturae TaxID=3028316 RepID=A0ABY8BZY6_9MICO|nr:DUF2252 domain-containing protein [Microbacterium sp. KACC 23027]WEG08550.1 DUF2252 domain-containing protein [Microbacterium sp. KACC 23027]